MSLRLRALERLEGDPEAAERWTEEPRTAKRTVRLRGTCRPSLATGQPHRALPATVATAGACTGA